MSTIQLPLFESSLSDQGAPIEGLHYREAFLDSREERSITDALAQLELKPFAFRGFLGHRRIASFGWRYDFNGGGLQRTAPLPAFLLGLRQRAATFADVAPEALENALVTEYVPGAGIGWHRDRAQFGKVVGVSLLAACRLRFRRPDGDQWTRLSLTLAPRSVYLLEGPARDLWQHSIAALDALRFSVTFRTFRHSPDPDRQAAVDA
jgi:alkylated DNA repair protein (DNA oxidative demethylase)